MSRKLAIILILTIFFVFIISSVFVYNLLKVKQIPVKKNSYLVLQISGNIPEYSSVKQIFNTKPPLTIWGIYNAVNRAKYDKRIKGIILNVSYPYIGMGKTDEIMDILRDFKSTGKKIYAYLEFASMKDYYLASIADKIYMIPTGSLLLNGFSFEVMFYKDMLEKIGIKADFLHIGKYKTYSNLYTKNKMTPAHKEFMVDILNNYKSHYLTVVSNNRGLKKQDLEHYINIGLFSPKDSAMYHLIDRVGYIDDLKNDLKNEETKLINTNKINLISYFDYYNNKNIYGKRLNNIALIFAIGQIQDGSNGYNPLFGNMMGSDTIIASIRRAKKDSSVKAIILRVNSPGGSGIASDKILRELKLTSKEKPIIVSMSDLAASGGYWISMASKEIIAHPLTITGSIGVVGGKFSLKGLYKKLGITVDRVEYGKYSHIFSASEDFTDDEKQLFYKNISDFYKNFLKVVAEGRKMKIEDVDSIGKGRVWLGETAIKLNLADNIGGLKTAFKEVKKITKLKYFGVITYPKKKSVLSELGLTNEIISKINLLKTKNIKNILPYKSFQPLALMYYIPRY